MVKKSFIALIAMLVGMFCGCTQAYHTESYAFRYYEQCSKEVFGNGITFQAAVRGGDTQAALAEMSALLEDINSDMSLTLSASALTRFNSAACDEKIEISRSTYEVIERSLALYRETDGAFNIAVYPLTRLWHVDTEGLNRYGMFGGEEPPSPPDYQTVLDTARHCDPCNLLLFDENGRYYIAKTDPELKIDLGAVAKGYAADKCKEIAEAHGVESALINISGNICLIGLWYHPDRKQYVRWEVGVTNPRPRGGLGGNVCALSVPEGKTLVTSGDYVRFYGTHTDDGELYVPHIMDGRTGLPLSVAYREGQYANTVDHIISATIICEDSTMADAYATAVCLMGRETATEFMRSHGLSGILFTQDGKMVLVGVTQDTTGEAYLIRGDMFSDYRSYTVEEIAVG